MRGGRVVGPGKCGAVPRAHGRKGVTSAACVTAVIARSIVVVIGLFLHNQPRQGIPRETASHHTIRCRRSNRECASPAYGHRSCHQRGAPLGDRCIGPESFGFLATRPVGRFAPSDRCGHLRASKTRRVSPSLAPSTQASVVPGGGFVLCV